MEPAHSPIVRVRALDHVVLRCDDPMKSLQWWSTHLGVQPTRVVEYMQGKAPFPSGRINGSTVIDFFKKDAPEGQQPLRQAEQAAGGRPTSVALPDWAPQQADPAAQQMDHLCLALEDGVDMEGVCQRLGEAGVFVQVQANGLKVVDRWGARGVARSVYIETPDGVVVELRSYQPASPPAGS